MVPQPPSKNPQDPQGADGLSDDERQTRERILDWAAPCFPLEVREDAVRVYHDYVQGRETEDTDYYVRSLVFGTGGLRGVIGNGPGRMNLWTVGRATLGFCRYLATLEKRASLVIAYDSRRMSREFAEAAAGVAARNDFTVYLFDRVASTPILSYAIRKLKATGGVVITASHNPPEYNGYKVYLGDGGQMVGPPQTAVEQAITAIGDWSDIDFLTPEDAEYRKRVKMVGDDIKKSYIAEFKKALFVAPARTVASKNLKVVYSPLHGTGGLWLPDLLEKYGFSVSMVPEQAEPDGEFPTVRFPNPEEPPALKMAQEKAKAMDANIFLATDPDADRLGAGVRTAPGQYVLLNGNQIGSIMCAYLCEKLSEARSKGPADKTRYHVLKTIVTTDLQKRIAEAHGVEVRDVLTGFKYIAEQMRFMEERRRDADYARGKSVYLFGGEESFGYLPVDFVRDKDAPASALLLCEIMAEVGDLVGYLNQIYLKYGLYLEDLKSVTMKGVSGQQRIGEIIEQLRTSNLTEWTLGERQVSAVLDYQRRTRNGKPDEEAFAGLPPANVLQLLLEPEGKLTIRPSGTEPKVKLYASLRTPDEPSSLDELDIARERLRNELVSLSGAFFARAGLAG